MASLSNFTPASLGPVVSEKLTRDNFLLWKAQFFSAIHGAQYMGILTGKTPEPPKMIEVAKADKKELVPNLEYDAWLAKDQQLLSYLLNSPPWSHLPRYRRHLRTCFQRTPNRGSQTCVPSLPIS